MLHSLPFTNPFDSQPTHSPKDFVQTPFLLKNRANLTRKMQFYPANRMLIYFYGLVDPLSSKPAILLSFGFINSFSRKPAIPLFFRFLNILISKSPSQYIYRPVCQTKCLVNRPYFDIFARKIDCIGQGRPVY